jgi:radical SAM protein with 4Fe4S-binding SPASM domain
MHTIQYRRTLYQRLDAPVGGQVKQLARAEYVLRHLRTFAPYITPAKLYNLALNLVELRLKVGRPRSLPPYLKVEPTPLCQMACPGCAHGDRALKKTLSRHREQLRLEEFKRIIDPIADTALGVSLSLRGEPLLGKDLLSIIEYGHSKNIAISFPTSLSVKLSDEKLLRLVKSGVDAIYISLDGVCEATYRQYRVGGDFHRVLRNVRAIAQAKAQLRQTRPRLIWKFVVFEHNRHEIPAVQAQFRQLGFDSYEFVDDYDGEIARSALDKHNANLVRKRGGCYWAWHTTTVRADGAIAPCCLGHNDFALGNVRTTKFRSIWRGERYAQLRRGFKTMLASDLHPVCARCLGVKGDRHDLRADLRDPSPSSAPPD